MYVSYREVIFFTIEYIRKNVNETIVQFFIH